MTLEEAIKQLEFDMDMITFDPTTGEILTLEQVKNRNESNYRSYLANQLAIEAIKKVIRQRDDDNVDRNWRTN